MAQAKYWFRKLTNEEEEEKKEEKKEKEEEKKEKNQMRNTFKPKVLTQVSHNGKWFVGSSVAVSHYLRPLYLCNRICDFKQSLKKAVVYFQPLETEDNDDWNSKAFWFKGGYTEDKFPCKNCRFLFQNLSGFLGGTDNLGEAGASDNTGRTSYLAACGEYPHINQCLPDDAESDNEAVNGALTNFRAKRLLYYQTFYDNVKDLIVAFESYNSKKDESKKLEILRNAYDEYVKDKIHIFGVKPECNDSLKP